MAEDLTTLPEYQTYAEKYGDIGIGAFLDWWKGEPNSNPKDYAEDYALLNALSAKGDTTAQDILAGHGQAPPSTFQQATNFFTGLVNSFGSGPSLNATGTGVTPPGQSVTSAPTPPASTGDAVIDYIRQFPSMTEYLYADFLGSGGTPGIFDADAYAASRPDLVNNWNAAQPTTPPANNAAPAPATGTASGAAKIDPLAALVGLLSAQNQTKQQPATVVVAPTSAPVTNATYNVNQNPSSIITPVLESQSGFFAGIMKGFDSLVSKVTDVGRTEKNPNNNLPLLASLQSRPQSQMSPIASLSQPRSPSSTAATVDGFSKTIDGPAEQTKSKLETYAALIAIIGGIVALYFYFRKRA